MARGVTQCAAAYVRKYALLDEAGNAASRKTNPRHRVRLGFRRVQGCSGRTAVSGIGGTPRATFRLVAAGSVQARDKFHRDAFGSDGENDHNSRGRRFRHPPMVPLPLCTKSSRQKKELTRRCGITTSIFNLGWCPDRHNFVCNAEQS